MDKPRGLDTLPGLQEVCEFGGLWDARQHHQMHHEMGHRIKGMSEVWTAKEGFVEEVATSLETPYDVEKYRAAWEGEKSLAGNWPACRNRGEGPAWQVGQPQVCSGSHPAEMAGLGAAGPGKERDDVGARRVGIGH